MSLEVSGGDGAVVTGDAIPSSLVHFANPGWRFGFDAVPEAAEASRRMILDRATAEQRVMMGDHWPVPVGRAEVAGGAFRFVAG